MVNCKSVVSATMNSVNNAICRSCKTQVCDECSSGGEHVDHHHACLPCIRLHLQFSELRVLSRECRPNRLPRFNFSPYPGRPRLDSLSIVAKDRNGRNNRSIPRSLSAHQVQELASVQCTTPTMRLKSEIREQTTADQRRRRHTSAIAPTSRSNDLRDPSKARKARQLLKTNATELQAAKDQNATSSIATGDLGDWTKRTAIAGATSSKPKDSKRNLPTKSKLDSLDVSKELRLPNLDPRHQRSRPIKQTHRASAASLASKKALIPIPVEHFTGIDTKFPSVELKLHRNHHSPEDLSKSPSILSRGRSKSAGKPVKNSFEPIDVNLSTVNRRLRQSPQASTNAITRNVKTLSHGKLNVGIKRGETQFLGPMVPFQRETNAQAIDFQLSSFDLKPPKHTATTTKRDKEERPIIKYSKAELCDLAYLEKFKSFTL